MEADGRRWWALAGVTVAVLAAGVDATVLAVALHASESALQWFSAGYLMVVAAAMLPAGLIGDRFGRKRTLTVALALFAGGSALCAASRSPAAFIAARVFLGLAAAGIIVMAVSALTVLFSPEERPKAVGVWAAANFVGVPVGPVLGGWILARHWWGWVFLMNVPVALLGLAAVVLLVPESRGARPCALDVPGVAASTAGLVGVTFGLIQAGSRGWVQFGTLAPIAAGLAVLVAFGWWERHLAATPGAQPLVDPALFASAPFTWGIVLMTVGVIAMMGGLFIMPQYFQGVAGANAMRAGLRLLPVVGGLIGGAGVADRLARHLGGRWSVAGGCALLAAGLALGAETRVGTGGLFAATWMALAGVGLGIAMTTAASGALVELSAERSGVGAAVLQALKNLGGPFGAAVLGSVLQSAYRAGVAAGGLPPAMVAAVRQSVFAGVVAARALGSADLLRAVRAAFVAGLDHALWVSAAVALVGVGLALAFFPGGMSPALPPQPASDPRRDATRRQAPAGSRRSARTS